MLFDEACYIAGLALAGGAFFLRQVKETSRAADLALWLAAASFAAAALPLVLLPSLFAFLPGIIATLRRDPPSKLAQSAGDRRHVIFALLLLVVIIALGSLESPFHIALRPLDSPRADYTFSDAFADIAGHGIAQVILCAALLSVALLAGLRFHRSRRDFT